ncbi:LacI family DNA-binding transcriptional regulator [Bifidobacterium choerinum]
MRKRVTLKEIAKEAEVSPAAVSLVLNNKRSTSLTVCPACAGMISHNTVWPLLSSFVLHKVG